MKNCSFELNGKSMSALKIESTSFPAFSGLGSDINKKVSMCSANSGPIPVGNYYIVDRLSGGRLGWFRDLFNEKSDWFALYAEDGKIDDEMWCQGVRRGEFRLHPKGRYGISLGCITIENSSDFNRVKAILRSGAGEKIKGTDIVAWGKVRVY